MKKIILIAIAFIGLQAMAQGQKKQDNNKRGNHQKMMNLTAEQMATLQTKKMTLALDLDASQQTEIYKMNLEKATKRNTMVAERKAKKESGEGKKPSEEERYAMANAKLDHMIATKAKMKKILNKGQFEKWEKAQKRIAKNRNDNKKGSKKRGQGKRG